MSGAQASNSGAEMTAPASTSAVSTRGRSSVSQVSRLRLTQILRRLQDSRLKELPNSSSSRGCGAYDTSSPAYWEESYLELRMIKGKKVPTSEF